MKKYKPRISSYVHALMISTLAFSTTQANASVKFRVDFEQDVNSYVIYMTPESLPTPDLPVATQVTIIVPYSESKLFTISNIQSHIKGINWEQHSQVDGPQESNQSSYISFGHSASNGTIPAFGWEQGKEMKVLSFQSSSGCDTSVQLIDNSDKFSQLPNSANTNPGNNFMNVGWMMANAYTGNYGAPIDCTVQTPTPVECEHTGNDTYYLAKIDRLRAVPQLLDR